MGERLHATLSSQEAKYPIHLSEFSCGIFPVRTAPSKSCKPTPASCSRPLCGTALRIWCALPAYPLPLPRTDLTAYRAASCLVAGHQLQADPSPPPRRRAFPAGLPPATTSLCGSRLVPLEAGLGFHSRPRAILLLLGKTQCGGGGLTPRIPSGHLRAPRGSRRQLRAGGRRGLQGPSLRPVRGHWTLGEPGAPQPLSRQDPPDAGSRLPPAEAEPPPSTSSRDKHLS